MTGTDVINRALVLTHSESSRALETGTTLGVYLQTALNQTIDDVAATWAFEWLLQSPAPIPTIPGPALTSSVYSLPTDMIEVIDIILDTGAIDTRKLVRLPLRDYKIKWAAQLYLPMDKPVNWCQINDTQFQVGPTPNAVYQMYLTGTVRPTPISDFDQPITAIPLRDHEGLCYGTAKRGAEAIKEYQLAQTLNGEYVKVINRMIQEDKRMPDVEYAMRPFRASPTIYGTNYWANPFVRNI